jgi:Transporter associated domain
MYCVLYTCTQAGEIPAVGDAILVGQYVFTVTLADERRIEEVHVRRVDSDPTAPLAVFDESTDAAVNGHSNGQNSNGYQSNVDAAVEHMMTGSAHAEAQLHDASGKPV